LDVGCGTGEFLGRCVDLGATGIGVEPSGGMREAAHRKVADATILDGHLAAIPLGDEAVDAAIATYVVSHLAPIEQPAALDELIRVVACDGPIVLVDVPRALPDDLPRVRDVLTAAGRAEQIEWFERGFGLDVPIWVRRFQDAGRRVVREPLGPLLLGLAGLPQAAPVDNRMESVENPRPVWTSATIAVDVRARLRRDRGPHLGSSTARPVAHPRHVASRPPAGAAHPRSLRAGPLGTVHVLHTLMTVMTE
jgi:SAM-dependent methyltransferase